MSGVNHALFGKRDSAQCVPSFLSPPTPPDPISLSKQRSSDPGGNRYGTATLADIEERVTKHGESLGVKILCAQTDYEGEMVQLVRFFLAFDELSGERWESAQWNADG